MWRDGVVVGFGFGWVVCVFCGVVGGGVCCEVVGGVMGGFGFCGGFEGRVWVFDVGRSVMGGVL